ncbi:MAG TPA: gamma-glutamylcyclotransferase family protein [Gammaproteobacteria bacterium]|nr:gamma-glutamylcyclotransferase family protein [Gammaproteobacteria bacterium]
MLFVYGTLRPFVDIEIAKWLRSNARYLGSATTLGRLYDLGAYPGMKASRGRRERVVGDVYRITKARVFRVLDRYEARFVRERCVVQLARGGRKIAWAYRYRYNAASAARIASGDYRIHRSS